MSTITRKLAGDGGAAIRRAFVEDFETMEAENQKLERTSKDLHETNERLVQENGMLHERLAEATRQRDKLQAYAVALTTRLDTVVEIVASAKKEALTAAMRPKAPVFYEDKDEATRAEERNTEPVGAGDPVVRDILSRVKEGAGEAAFSPTRPPRVSLAG